MLQDLSQALPFPGLSAKEAQISTCSEVPLWFVVSNWTKHHWPYPPAASRGPALLPGIPDLHRLQTGSSGKHAVLSMIHQPRHRDINA